jgi:membrane protein required for colicin V production
MLIDLLCGLLLLFAVWKGWSNGFFVSLVSFVGLLIGLLIGFKCSHSFASWLHAEHGVTNKWLPVFSFLILLIGVWLLLQLAAKLLTGIVQMIQLGWINKIAGALLYGCMYAFWISGLLFFASRMQLFSPQTIRESYLYPWLHPLTSSLIEWIGSWIPSLKSLMPELERMISKAG